MHSCMMARNKRRRTKRDWTPIPIQVQEALATLANNTALVEGLVSSDLTHDYRCTSVELQWALDELTAGEGPITVGLAHSDYTIAEIEEFLEQEAPLGPSSKVEREIAGRFIRRVGTFAGDTTHETLNDGKPIKTRLNWLIADGFRINMWCYNNSGAALTTGATVRAMGTHNGYWVY